MFFGSNFTQEDEFSNLNLLFDTQNEFNNENINFIITNEHKNKLKYDIDSLTDENHLKIFEKIFLVSSGKRIYSITENCVLFDLNDLTDDDFKTLWKFVYILKSDEEKRKKKNVEDMSSPLFSSSLSSSSSAPTPAILSENKEYNRLMEDALKKCTYSTYYKEDENKHIHMSSSLKLKNDDTEQQRKIYSDTYSGSALFHKPTPSDSTESKQPAPLVKSSKSRTRK